MVKIDDDLKESVVLCLCNRDNAPNKDIEKIVGVDGASITRVLRKIEPFIKTTLGANNMRLRSLKSDITTAQALITLFDHDRPAQIMFMRSHYCHAMMPDLVEQFTESIPDADLWMFDTHQHTATREQPFTNAGTHFLTDALKSNWLALKFVAHFISVDSEERSAIIEQLMETTHNPHISPSASRAAGYTNGVCAALDRCAGWIRDDAELAYHRERLNAEWNDGPKHLNWREFFSQLDNLNTNYAYLF